MTATTTLPRYTREYVNLSDLLDALGIIENDDMSNDITDELSRHYSWGDSAATLADATFVARCVEDALPDDDPRISQAYALLDGVNYVNLEG